MIKVPDIEEFTYRLPPFIIALLHSILRFLYPSAETVPPFKTSVSAEIPFLSKLLLVLVIFTFPPFIVIFASSPPKMAFHFPA